MHLTWFTKEMLKNAGYVERSHPRAIVKNWMRSGVNPFPRFHVIKDRNAYDIHIDMKEEHGRGQGNIETRGDLIKWELARIRHLHYKKQFEDITVIGYEKKKKLLSNETNFYQLCKR